MNMVVGLLRASALLGPVSFPHMGGGGPSSHGGVRGGPSSRTPGLFHVGHRRHGAGDSSDTPLVAATADQAPCAKPLSPTVP